MNTKYIKMKLILWISLVAVTGVGSVASTYEHKLTENLIEIQQSGGYQIGDAVGNFSLKNVDGRMISLSDFNSSKGIIVVFTSNHCPFAKAYEDRIIALNNKYSSQGFPVIAINPSDPGTHVDDSFDKMKERASSKGYNYPYLADESQATAKAFGAARTPQVYVLSKSNGKFTVRYMGMLDDNPQDPAGASKFYVDEAVSNLISGKPVVTMSTKPIGCAIKWKN
ncbi:AhpC/TSA family protein [Dyadobacter koreensis]|uniref:AhpC/TSA family protein n=2 Tax=Dyadobacter koreensis TaxID=408657 RepID=A0A1H6TM67_9BACT|nr:AhpC/TSA family protein [Dyadobacter koreensis]